MPPLTYVRNRLTAATAAAVESLVRRQPWYEVNEVSGTQLWRHEAAGVVEHPELSGLYLMRAAVEPSGVSAIRALVDAVIHPPRSRGVHGEAEAASREAEVLLQQSKLAPAGSEEAVEAAEIASASLARRDALRARAAE